MASFYTLREAIGAPVQAASDFESAMADVAKVVDFPTPAAFEQFQQDLFALSREIPISVNGLADIAAAAGQAGIAGDDLIRFTDAASRIGVAFDIGADQAGGSMANLMTALGLTIDETVSLADAMNHLSNNQASSAAEVLDVVQRVGAQASMFGFTAEETSAFASAMVAAGAQSEVAATSFRNMGRALTLGEAATGRQREAFRELGLDAEQVARQMQEDAVGTTVDVLRRISQLPKEQRAAISSQLFGNEARALGPLLTNLGLVEDTLGMVGDRANYAGSAFDEFEARNNTFQANMQRFQNVLTELQISIGNGLMPAISRLAEAIAPLITRLADLANAYPDVTLAVVGATAAVIAFKGAMSLMRFAGLLGRGGVLSLIAAGYNTIGRAAIGAKAAASSMIGLQTALAAMTGRPLGTIGRIRAGLTGVALAVPGVSALASGISAIGAAMATISAPVWGTFAAIAAAVAAAGFTIWKYWDRLTAIFEGVGSVIMDRLNPAIERFRPLLERLEPVVDTLLTPFRALRDAASSLFEFISGLFESDFFTREQLSEEERASITARTEEIINTFLGLPGRLLEIGRQAIQGLWDGMVEKFGELIEWVRGIPGRIADAIGNIDLKSLLTGGQPDVVISPTIEPSVVLPPRTGADVAGVPPMGDEERQEIEDYLDGTRAGGGPISRGGRYLVGEEGPELITANRNGYVHSTGQGPMGGSFEVSINAPITVNGGVSDPQQLAAEISRQMRDEVREAFRGVFADTGMRFA
ncbi:phage tail tape measure protein [Roseovarius sp. SYSU LYC5161]|uniref:phage tail tape measure protein n=1 Tax=Roseovarius halophilus (ex Wu et al. 2025) TaxID=3376060 RepID=UPI00399C39D6